jgi:RNA polymerase sigma factor (sigma-70 family)
MPITQCLEIVELKCDLEKFLTILSDRERQIVITRILGDSTFKELANILGLHKGYVHQIYHRAIRKLSHKLYAYSTMSI